MRNPKALDRFGYVLVSLGIGLKGLDGFEKTRFG
jgi:hypothetical protein